MKPRFIHVCNHCTFLGPHRDVDLYHCDGERPTVIARYGDKWLEYRSGLEFVGFDEDLTEAARRAVEQGLLDPAIKTGGADESTAPDSL